MEEATPDELHVRIAELEKQLADAKRAGKAHETIEARLSDALAYAENIVDTVRESLLVLDGELRIKTANHAFYESFGVCAEETIGQFLYDLGNGQWNIPVLKKLLGEVLPHEKSLRDFEVVHDFPSLGRRAMLLNARTLWREANNSERVLLAIEDVTERKRIADELLRSNEDLQRFAYVAAHDLRSPLNTALNISRLLERRLQGRLDQKELSMLGLSIENMERLAALMHDILTYSEIANAPEDSHLVPIQEPLAIALANLQHHIEKSGAMITFGELPSAHANRTQTAMVFQNLIGNALKYRRDETPRIVIAVVPEDGHWQISSATTGKVLKPNTRPKFSSRSSVCTVRMCRAAALDLPHASALSNERAGASGPCPHRAKVPHSTSPCPVEQKDSRFIKCPVQQIEASSRFLGFEVAKLYSGRLQLAAAFSMPRSGISGFLEEILTAALA